MWNRSFRIIWVKVHITGARHFYLNLPISLYALKELLECLTDLMELACLFIPKNLPSHSPGRLSVRAVMELIDSVDMLFRSGTNQEPYDLVEVNVKNVTVAVKIR